MRRMASRESRSRLPKGIFGKFLAKTVNLMANDVSRMKVRLAMTAAHRLESDYENLQLGTRMQALQLTTPFGQEDAT